MQVNKIDVKKSPYTRNKNSKLLKIKEIENVYLMKNNKPKRYSRK